MDAPPAPLAPAVRAALASLAAAAAVGAGSTLEARGAAARAVGADEALLREALFLVVPYAGFPRALHAFHRVRPAAGPAGEAAPESRARQGRAAFEAVYGPTAPRVAEGLQSLDPLLAAWTLEHAYGRVIARPGLALVERELLAVAMLTALGGLDDPLLGHMRGALRLGASRAEVAAAVDAAAEASPASALASARALLARA